MNKNLELLMYIYEIDYLDIKYNKIDRLWYAYFSSNIYFGILMSKGDSLDCLVLNMESTLKSMEV